MLSWGVPPEHLKWSHALNISNPYLYQDLTFEPNPDVAKVTNNVDTITLTWMQIILVKCTGIEILSVCYNCVCVKVFICFVTLHLFQYI